MWSAWRTCCSTSRMPVDRSLATRRTVWSRRFTITGARPSDSSSTRSSLGSRATARASVSICCSPPDSSPAVRPMSGSSSGKSVDRVSLGDARDPEVLLGGELHEDGTLFGDEPHPVAGPPEQRRLRHHAAEHDVAGDRRELAGERQQRGRLPRAVRSDERDDLTGLDVEIEVAHHRDARRSRRRGHGTRAAGLRVWFTTTTPPSPAR